jgi:hypothetical protein
MKDNIKQALQVVLILLGPLLIKHHITFGNDLIDELAGTASDVWGIIWKFWHWNTTPDATPTDPPKTPPMSMGGAIHMILIAGLCLGLSGCLTGCGTPQHTAYVAAGGVQVSAETAMAAWNVYVGQYHPPLHMELQVKAAYEKYQAAMVVVCDAGAIYASTSVTNAAGIMGASAALDTARNNASQDLADLVALIRALGVKV